MSYNTVKIKKYVDIVEEIEASAAITPGMLLEVDSNGKVKPHSNAGQNALTMFALENELEGKDLADDYANGDKVQVWIPQRGETVYAILKDGENVSIGDYVESSGDGYLQKHTADKESFESAEAGVITVYPEQIVGQVLEAKDLSQSSGLEGESSGFEMVDTYNQRILIRIA